MAKTLGVSLQFGKVVEGIDVVQFAGVDQGHDRSPQVLAGELYGPLRSLEQFNQVRIDRETGTLVWPSGADFDPAILHDWPRHREAFQELLTNWQSVEARGSR